MVGGELAIIFIFPLLSVCVVVILITFVWMAIVAMYLFWMVILMRHDWKSLVQ